MILYLSTHDLVWINNTVTGKSPEFDYEALEECMAAQYSYGDSTNVSGQAGFMLDKILKRKPFEFGNVRTAFIALLAFLTANRQAVKGADSEIAGALQEVAEGRRSASDALQRITESTELGLRPGVTLRTLVAHLCNERREVLRLLAAGDQ